MAIVGPNGAGKTTLIKAMLNLVNTAAGQVKIYGESPSNQRRLVGYVPQRGSVDWDFPTSVKDVVMMGRYGHVPWWRGFSPEDHRIVNESLDMVRLGDLKQRQIGQLSGGQQQRVFMARAMAQGADILLLDEPFAGVDAATERAILDVLHRTKAAGKTLMVVHHDLATAAEYFDLLILLKQRMFAFGPPEAVLNPELLSQAYEGHVKAFEGLRAAAKERKRAPGCTTPSSIPGAISPRRRR